MSRGRFGYRDRNVPGLDTISKFIRLHLPTLNDRKGLEGEGSHWIYRLTVEQGSVPLS